MIQVQETGRIIGILNHKGGTGKTTTVVNLAAGLARQGARVLCIDLDAQGGLATCFDVTHPYTVTHLLLGEAEPQECIVQGRENVDLVISDRSLRKVERKLWDAGESAVWRLAERMQRIGGYDYVLLDYSPAANLLSECGLLYSREVIVPVAMDYMALVGVRQVIESLQAIEQEHGHSVRLSLIVPTFYDERQRLDREVMELLQSRFSDKLAEPIRANVRLSEAPSHAMTIYEYEPESSGAADYTRLVERVMNCG
jgi:chromosome partitioning protein